MANKALQWVRFTCRLAHRYIFTYSRRSRVNIFYIPVFIFSLLRCSWTNYAYGYQYGIISTGEKQLFPCIAGILLSNFTVVLLISLGIGTFIKDSLHILNFIKYCGAFYLFYIGIQSLIKSLRCTSLSRHNISPQITKNRSKVSFLKGFLTSITNPKLLLFYLAFLPQFFTGTYEYNIELFLWGLFYIFIVFSVMSTYGMMASLFTRYFLKEVSNKIIKRIVGLSFISFGIGLLKYKHV